MVCGDERAARMRPRTSCKCSATVRKSSRPLPPLDGWAAPPGPCRSSSSSSLRHRSPASSSRRSTRTTHRLWRALSCRASSDTTRVKVWLDQRWTAVNSVKVLLIFLVINHAKVTYLLVQLRRNLSDVRVAARREVEDPWYVADSSKWNTSTYYVQYSHNSYSYSYLN